MTAVLPEMILFSHLCNPVVVTGAEKVLLKLARELQRHFRCTFVVPQDGAIAAGARAAGMETVVLNVPLAVSIYSASPTVREDVEMLRRGPAWRNLLRLLRKRRPACVLVNTCVHPLPALAAKQLGIPVVWYLNETMMDTPHRPLAVELIAANADRILGTSHATLAAFPPERLANRLVLLPPTVDRAELDMASWPAARAELRARFGWDEGHRVVGFIAATIYAGKGLREFVQAFLSLAARNAVARALVVGSPTENAYYDECRQLAQLAGCGDRIGWLPFAERIERIYPAMDVVTVPSLIPEGFGMAALEGLCFEKPVVAFASGGLVDILNATGNGDFLVPVGDAGAMAAKLEALLADDARRVEIGRQGAAAAEAAFGPAAFRARLEALVGGLPKAAHPARRFRRKRKGKLRRRTQVRVRRASAGRTRIRKGRSRLRGIRRNVKLLRDRRRSRAAGNRRSVRLRPARRRFRIRFGRRSRFRRRSGVRARFFRVRSSRVRARR